MKRDRPGPPGPGHACKSPPQRERTDRAKHSEPRRNEQRAHVCMIACPNSDSTQLRRSCLSLAEAAALNCEEQRDGGEKSGRMGRAAIRENLRAPAHRVQV